MSNQRLVRVLRATAAASTATLIALVGHVLGGGDVPSWLGVIVPLLVSLFVAVPLIGARLSLWRTASVVVASQLLFHWLFVLGSTGSAESTSVEMPGMNHGDAGSVIVSAHTMATPAMSIGHIIAAAVTVAALYQGERVARAISDLAFGFVCVVLDVALGDVPEVIRTQVFVDGLVKRLSFHSTDFSRRGPPQSI